MATTLKATPQVVEDSGRDFRADELTLWTTAPIQWGNVGIDPEDYHGFYPALFEVSSDWSLYQSLLPADLQLTEFLQIWLKDETIPVVLRRLRHSTPVVVDRAFATGGSN
jgi:hypothetical protein